MTREIVIDYDAKGYFKGESLCFDGALPYRSTRVLPPPLPWENVWPRFDEKKQVWELIEDYRERTPRQGFLEEKYQQPGVPYWLPGDTDPMGRYMQEPGPFPPNALFQWVKVETPDERLREIKTKYRIEFNALSLAYQGALMRKDTDDINDISRQYADLQREMAVEFAQAEMDNME